MTLPNMANNNVENANPPDENAQAGDSQLQPNPSSEDQNKNWKALRQSKEDAERRERESLRQNEEYKKLISELNAAKQQPEEEYDDSDIPTFGQTKQTVRQEAKKIAKEMIEQTLAEQRQTNAPKQLKRDYSDFDEVVTKENVDYLIENDPESAEILRETTDLYKQGKRAYIFIKKAGINKKDSTEGMRQDAQDNFNKPVSPNAGATKNSVGDANMFSKGLTPELQKQLRQEMTEAIKRR